MVEITEDQLKEARFYHEVYMLLMSFTTWRKLPPENFDAHSIKIAFEIIRWVLSMKD